MRLINSSAEYIPQENLYTQIEICGRTCYKSKMSNSIDGAEAFVNRMIESKHTAMLEHGTVYLFLEITTYNRFKKFSYPLVEGDYDWGDVANIIRVRYQNNPYSKVIVQNTRALTKIFITTNYRVIIENGWNDDLQFISKPLPEHVKRYTFKFVTDMGIARELCRHRKFSFAQESTRYCNYSKDKFNNELTFIIPSWTDNLDLLSKALNESEKFYLDLINKGLSAQQARQVLPLALKTEICMTGYEDDWRYLFELRLFGTTGKPHPDMVLLMKKTKEEAETHKIWNFIKPINYDSYANK